MHQTSMVTSLDEATKINKVTVNFGISKLIFIGLNYNISRSHETAKGEIVTILIVELIKVTHSQNISLNRKTITFINKNLDFRRTDYSNCVLSEIKEL